MSPFRHVHVYMLQKTGPPSWGGQILARGRVADFDCEDLTDFMMI